jgi:hypothetical protein
MTHKIRNKNEMAGGEWQIIIISLQGPSKICFSHRTEKREVDLYFCSKHEVTQDAEKLFPKSSKMSSQER